MKLTTIVILLESGHLSFLDVVHYFVGLHTYTLHCHRTDVLGLDLYKVMATRGLRQKEVCICDRSDLLTAWHFLCL